MGQKRIIKRRIRDVRFTPETDMFSVEIDVCFVPEADIAER